MATLKIPKARYRVVLLAIVYNFPYSETDIKNHVDLFNDVHGDGMQLKIVEISQQLQDELEKEIEGKEG